MISKLDNLRARLAEWLCPEVFHSRESLRSDYTCVLSQRDKAKQELSDYRIKCNAEKQALEVEVQTLIADKAKQEEQLRELTKKVDKYKGFKVLFYNLRRQLEDRSKR